MDHIMMDTSSDSDEMNLRDYVEMLRKKNAELLKDIRMKNDKFISENINNKPKFTPQKDAKSIFELNAAIPSALPDKTNITVGEIHDKKVTISEDAGNVQQHTPIVFKYTPYHIPPYNYYTPLRNNYRVDDERKLHFIPYYGDDQYQYFDERDLRLFDLPPLTQVDKNKSRKVFYENDDVIIKQVLDKYGDDDEVIEELSDIFSCSEDVTRSKIKEVKKRFRETTREVEFCLRNAYDTFRVLFCDKCKIYDCQLHKGESTLSESEKFRKQRDTEMIAKTILGLHKKVKNVNSYCDKDCFKKEKITDVEEVEWSSMERALLEKSILVFENDFCAIAEVIQNKTCRQIFEYTMKLKNEYKKMYPDGVNIKKTKQRKGGHPENIVKQKMKEPNFKPCCWYPCKCDGVCTEKCTCAQSTNFCSKWCKCNPQCKNRFKGCTCSAGTCQTQNCPCFKAGRECDPDLCTRCKSKCCNRGIQNGAFKHIALAKSSIHGWGAFLLEPAKKNDFLYEYVGEVISQEEAERRGKFYDKSNCSYLFDLTEEYVIDAYRKGNKSRFINHSENPNCECRIVYVNGDYRIGVYAKRDIQCGEELYFDYRYGKQGPSWANKDKKKKKGLKRKRPSSTEE